MNNAELSQSFHIFPMTPTLSSLLPICYEYIEPTLLETCAEKDKSWKQSREAYEMEKLIKYVKKLKKLLRSSSRRSDQDNTEEPLQS